MKQKLSMLILSIACSLFVIGAIPTHQIELESFLTPFSDELPIPTRLQISKDTHEITITMNQFKYQIQHDLPDVQEWGYNGASPGPTIEVEQGQKLLVHWKNELPTTHLFPAPTGMMDDPKLPDVRNVVHLHGAVVTESDPMNRAQNNDGWPDAWITPGQEQLAEYPNEQSSRMLWYHDHAMGETGRNVAAGLVGMYLIRDSYERSLNLPSGSYEVPLLIQARGVGQNGSLYYTRKISKEYYGNGVFVNGKLYPYLNVEPRKYRFRVLNASNARTLALRLFDLANLKVQGPEFYQIGTESGFLEKTAVLNDPNSATSPRLVLAPAERADIIIDFSKYAGRNFMLQNNAVPDDPDATLPVPRVMAFKVGTSVSQTDTSQIPMTMRPITRFEEKDAAVTRPIVFAQVNMADGSPMLQLNKAGWTDPITEKPVINTKEIWQLINTLKDTHPFHIHLVQFQVLDRIPFDVAEYNKSGKLNYTGAAVLPDPNEMGWKDTVRVIPLFVTRIMMQFGPYTGYYVYHCHILEHEDMDMMRPFQIVP